MHNYVISSGLKETHRRRAAVLYLEAFGAKIGGILGRGPNAIDFLAGILSPDHAISALNSDGQLLGIAGFKTPDGAFVGGTFSDLRRSYGLLGGLWRGAILEVLERKTEDGVLLMDGICVAEDARGLGVGSALLDAIAEEAKTRRLSGVRLDVIDKNPRARQLYLRKGYKEGKTHHIGPLSRIFGFSSATTMRLAV